MSVNTHGVANKLFASMLGVLLQYFTSWVFVPAYPGVIYLDPLVGVGAMLSTRGILGDARCMLHHS